MNTNQLEFKGYKTGVLYRFKNMNVKIHSFCLQKVWIEKEQKFRVREFALIKPELNNWIFKWQIGETKWV